MAYRSPLIHPTLFPIPRDGCKSGLRTLPGDDKIHLSKCFSILPIEHKKHRLQLIRKVILADSTGWAQNAIILGDKLHLGQTGPPAEARIIECKLNAIHHPIAELQSA